MPCYDVNGNALTSVYDVDGITDADIVLPPVEELPTAEAVAAQA